MNTRHNNDCNTRFLQHQQQQETTTGDSAAHIRVGSCFVYKDVLDIRCKTTLLPIIPCLNFYVESVTYSTQILHCAVGKACALLAPGGLHLKLDHTQPANPPDRLLLSLYCVVEESFLANWHGALSAVYLVALVFFLDQKSTTVDGEVEL